MYRLSPLLLVISHLLFALLVTSLPHSNAEIETLRQQGESSVRSVRETSFQHLSDSLQETIKAKLQITDPIPSFHSFASPESRSKMRRHHHRLHRSVHRDGTFKLIPSQQNVLDKKNIIEAERSEGSLQKWLRKQGFLSSASLVDVDFDSLHKLPAYIPGKP